MATQGSGPNLLVTIGVGALAIIGSVAKSSQWRDPKTGDINPALVTSGLAACLLIAAIVRAAGVHYGIEPWVQCAISGVLCYAGPDPIIQAVAGMILKRYGVDPNGNNDKKS